MPSKKPAVKNIKKAVKAVLGTVKKSGKKVVSKKK